MRQERPLHQGSPLTGERSGWKEGALRRLGAEPSKQSVDGQTDGNLHKTPGPLPCGRLSDTWWASGWGWVLKLGLQTQGEGQLWLHRNGPKRLACGS